MRRKTDKLVILATFETTGIVLCLEELKAKVRILFISNLFPDAAEPYRGLDNATLLHHLAEIYEIRVLCPRASLPFAWRTRESRQDDASLSPTYVPAPYVPKVGSRWNHRLMAAALREPVEEIRKTFTFDVVLCSWLYPDVCAVSLMAAELGFPFVAIAQGSDVHQYLQMSVRRKVMLSGLLGCRRIITRSAELGRLLTAAGVPPEKLRTIYNGVDLAIFQPGDRETIRRDFGMASDTPVILFVGNLFPIKDPLLLVRAHARLRREGIGCSLLMIGAGELESLIRHESAEGVQLLGRLASEQIARYMNAADVLCVPSRNEGVPNVILEALACGLRVVATRVGGIPEVITHDDLGKLVPPGDEQALADALRELLTSHGDSARIRAYGMRYSWKQSTLEYSEVLEQSVF